MDWGVKRRCLARTRDGLVRLFVKPGHNECLGMRDALPDETILKRLQGLLNLAAKNSNPEEAASAAAKAQELLARYNLTAESVEQGRAAADGKREQAAVDGGTYAWQRELWGAVARLNFCLHWVQSHELFIKNKRVGTGLRRTTTQGWVLKKRHTAQPGQDLRPS